MPFKTVEISVRLKGPNKAETPFIHNTADAVAALRKIFKRRTIMWVEDLYMLCLDHGNRLMCYRLLSSGGRDRTVVDLNVIQLIASQLCARRVILAHNHTSGSLTPSPEDIDNTRKVRTALSALNIDLLDHIILTADSHISLRDYGLFG